LSSAVFWASVNSMPTKFGTATGPVGCLPPPERRLKTRNPARARMTIAMIPATQPSLFEPDSSASSAIGAQ
jgi:hypothetical protein